MRWPIRLTDPEFILDSVLPSLGLADWDCGLNNMVCVAATLPGRQTPPVECLTAHWVPWDTPLSIARRFHFVFTERQMYQDVLQAVERIGGTIDLAPSDCTDDDVCLTMLELSYRCGSQTIEACGRLNDQCQAMQLQIAQHDETINLLRNRLGIVMEYLASRDPALIEAFGLNAHQNDPR